MTPASPERRWADGLPAGYFAVVRGAGFLATKVGRQHVAPFTFWSLR